MKLSMLDPKILITGTGRCGTSFLQSIFWKLGYFVAEDEKHKIMETPLPPDGTLEKPFQWNQRPYVMKSPGSSTLLARAIWKGEGEYYFAALKHVLIPVRDPSYVAESHSRRGWQIAGVPRVIRENVSMADQATWVLGNLVSALTYADTPFTLMDFPRMAEDCTYLHDMLIRSGVMRFNFEQFETAWSEVNKYGEAKGKSQPDYEAGHW